MPLWQSTVRETPSRSIMKSCEVYDHLRPIFSARVSLGYRALAIREEDTWVWFWIGSHSDYDQLLSRL